MNANYPAIDESIARYFIEHAKAGDRVTILSPQGAERTGRMVMRGPAGLVLNMGGKYGTPAVATVRNIVSVQPDRRSMADVFKARRADAGRDPFSSSYRGSDFS